MSCYVYYGKKYSDSDAVIVNEVHKKVFNEVKESGHFKIHRGRPFLSKHDSTKIMLGLRTIREVNEKYGFGHKVVGHNAQTREVKVNMNPAMDKYIEAMYSDYEVQKRSYEEKASYEQYFQVDTSDFAPSDEIYEKLMPVLDSLGVSITNFETYKANYKERTGQELPGDVAAVADIAKRVIAIDSEREGLDTLPEEVMHFVVEAMSEDFRVLRAIELILNNEEITSSALWQNYLEKYDGDLTMTAKEFLGQKMAEHLVRGQDTGLINRLVKLLERIWARFFKQFSESQELRDIVRELTNASLEGNLTLPVHENLQYFQLSLEEVTKRMAASLFNRRNTKELVDEHLIEKVYNDNGELIDVDYTGMYKKLREMSDKLKLRYRRLHFQGKSFSKKEAKNRVKNVYNLIENNKGTRALVDILQYAKDDLNKAMQRKLSIEALQKNPVELAKHMREIQEVVHMYGPLIRSVQAQLSLYEPSTLPKELFEDEGFDPDDFELEGKIRDHIAIQAELLGGTLSRLEGIIEGDSLEIFADYIYDAIKINKDITRNDVVKMLQEGDDIAPIRRWMMGMAESTNDILAGIHKIIEKLKHQKDAHMYERIGEMNYKVHTLKEAGVTKFDWFYEKLDGALTGNFVTRWNREKFDNEFKAAADRINNAHFLPEDKLKREKILTSIEGRVTPAFEKWLDENITKEPVATYWAKAQNKYSDLASQLSFTQKVLRNSYNAQWNTWFKDNTETHPEHAKVMYNHIKKIWTDHLDNNENTTEAFNQAVRMAVSNHSTLFETDVTGPTITLTHQQFEAMTLMKEWVEMNSGYSTYKAKMEGDGYYYKGDLIVPNAQYNNAAYDEIMRDKNKREFYEYIMDLKEEYDNMLPSDTGKHYLAPQIRRDTLDRVVNGEAWTAIKEGIKELKTRQEDDIEFGTSILDENYGKVRTAPVHYTSKLTDMKELALDPARAMIQYMSMAKNYSIISDHVDILELGYDIVQKRAIKGSKSRLKFSQSDVRETVKHGGNVAALLRDSLDSLIYGETKKKETSKDGKVDYGKLADSFNKYTSLVGLGFNLAASITNPLVTRLLHTQEGIANEYVSSKELFNADKLYAKYLPGMLNDVGSLVSDSKLRHFTAFMDLTQDFGKNIHNAQTNRSRAMRLASDNMAYMGMYLGEHQVTARMGIAIANQMKLTLDGKEISLFPAGIEIVNNVFKIKEGVLKEDGTPLTIEDLNNLKSKITSVNQRLVGVYNEVDRAALKRSALGRMAMIFRSWMPASVNRRYGKKYFDYRTEQYTEGMYISTYNFGKQVIADLIQGQIQLGKRWGDMTMNQRKNVIRSFIEIATTIAAGIAISILTKLSDDDDENYMLALAAVQANRIFMELRFYTHPGEFMKLVQAPAAGIRQLQILFKLADSFQLGDYMAGEGPFIRRYKGGRHEGETYFGVNALRLVPFVEQVDRWFHPYEILEFYED